MAQFTRRRGRKVYVYYFNQSKGRQVQLPRSETKHLDTCTDEEAEAWVVSWEQAHGLERDRIRRAWLKEDDRLYKLWDAYKRHVMSLGGVRESTWEQTDGIFHRHILAYFIGEHEQKDLSKWHALIPGLREFLAERLPAQSSIGKVLQQLSKFGRWLVYMQVMDYAYTIISPKAPNNKVTPLKKRVSPDDILTFKGETTHGLPLRLMVLVGYFFSLRPSELFALNKSDFLTGTIAKTSSRAHAGLASVGCGSGLSVVIAKTLVDGSVPKPLTKTDYSFGVVNCWSVEAAKIIAGILKDMPDGRLIPGSRGWLDRAWKDLIKSKLGATAHDLRRASILYLGRTVRVPLITLQEHARHSEIETTLLYARDPAIPEITSEQDFTDVG